MSACRSQKQGSALVQLWRSQGTWRRIDKKTTTRTSWKFVPVTRTVFRIAYLDTACPLSLCRSFFQRQQPLCHHPRRIDEMIRHKPHNRRKHPPRLPRSVAAAGCRSGYLLCCPCAFHHILAAEVSGKMTLFGLLQRYWRIFLK